MTHFFEQIWDRVQSDAGGDALKIAKTIVLFPTQRACDFFKKTILLADRAGVMPRIYSLGSVWRLLSESVPPKHEALSNYERFIHLFNIVRLEGMDFNVAIDLTGKIARNIAKMNEYGVECEKLLEAQEILSGNLSEKYLSTIDGLVRVMRAYDELELLDFVRYRNLTLQSLREYLMSKYSSPLSGHELKEATSLYPSFKEGDFGCKTYICGFEFNTVYKRGLLELGEKVQIVNFEADDGLREIDFVTVSSVENEVKFIVNQIKKALVLDRRQNIGIVLNDAKLAQKITNILMREGISYNDVFGVNLADTKVYQFFKMIGMLARQKLDVIVLLSFLKSPYFKYHDMGAVVAFERDILRQDGKFFRHQTLEELHYAVRNFAKENVAKKGIVELLEFVLKIKDLNAFKSPDFTTIMKLHWEMFLQFAGRGGYVLKEEGATSLYPSFKEGEGNDYAELEMYVVELCGLETPAKCYNMQEYLLLLDAFTQTRTYLVKTEMSSDKFGKIHILNPLEAQLINFDVCFVAGFDSATFPSVDERNYFLAEQIKAYVGLPTCKQEYEEQFNNIRNIISASRKVYISFSSKSFSGQKGVEVSTFINSVKCLPNVSLVERSFDPVVLRTDGSVVPSYAKSGMPFPQQVWATQLRNLIQTPYCYYIANVLKLKPIRALTNVEVEANDVGNLVHLVLEIACQQIANGKVEVDVLQIVREQIASFNISYEVFCAYYQAFYNLSFDVIRSELVALRDGGYQFFTESANELRLENGIVVGAKADRLDVGDCVIVNDYKTGELPSESEILSLYDPQMFVCLATACMSRNLQLKSEFAVKIVPVLKCHLKADVEVKLGREDVELGVDLLAKLLDYFSSPEAVFKLNPHQKQLYNNYEYEKYKHFIRIV